MNSNTNIMLSLATTLLPADSQSEDDFHDRFPDERGVAYINGVTLRPSLTKKYILLELGEPTLTKLYELYLTG